MDKKKELRMAQVMPMEMMDSKEMIVEGTAIVFNNPIVLFEDTGQKFYEIIKDTALDECDMSDVVLRYNHCEDVPLLARTRGGSLELIKDKNGLNIRAKIVDTCNGRDIYKLVQEGVLDKMSFAFIVEEDEYTANTRIITRISKLIDVSLVDIPAYDATSVSARDKFKAIDEHTKLVQKLILKTYL